LALIGGVAEVDLVLLGYACGLDSFLAGEFIGEVAEAGGVVGAGNTILRGLLEGIVGAGECSLGLPGDGGLIGGTVAWIVENGLVL